MKLRLPKNLRYILLASAMMAPGISEASMYTEETHLTSFADVTDNTIHFSNGSANSSIDCTNGDLSNENMALRQYDTPISITGGHEVTIGRYVGCDIMADNKETAKDTTLNIGTGTTLTVVGDDNHSASSTRPWADGTFVIGRMSSKTATVNVNGTLNIRNATISADDASGILNIKSGGTVNVKSLGTWNRNGGTVTVNLEDGGVLNLGEGGIANKDRLNLNLNGGTIGIDGANGATSWTSSKALQLNGDVTFNTAIQNSSEGLQQAGTTTGTIKLSALNANGHSLTATGGGTLSVESLTGSVTGLAVGTNTTLQLVDSIQASATGITLNNEGTVDFRAAIAQVSGNGYTTVSSQLVTLSDGASLTQQGNGSYLLNGVAATLHANGTLSSNDQIYAVVTGSVTTDTILEADPSVTKPFINVGANGTLAVTGEISAAASDSGQSIVGSNITMENGATLQLNDGVQVNGAVTLIDGASINVTVDAKASVTWDAGATITTGNGIGTLTLGNGSTWNISDGINTFSGATIQTQGSDGATITGGTLSLSGTTTLNTADAGSTLTITSDVTSAALTKTGAGTVTISGNASITGALNLGASNTENGGILELKGSQNTISGSGLVSLKNGELITHGTTNISKEFDLSGGSHYNGKLVVADGTTTLTNDRIWLRPNNDSSAFVVRENATLKMHNVAIGTKASEDASITNTGTGDYVSLTSSGLKASNASLSTTDSLGDSPTLSWQLQDSKLTNQKDGCALIYNGTATNSDFVNASTGTTQVGKAVNNVTANNVTLKGDGATATGVTTSDSGFTASSVSTVAGTATTFTGNVTVTGSLTAAAMATNADFISTGEVTGISSTSGRQVLFASDSASAIQSTFQSTGSGTTLTLGDGATLTLGGALAASDGDTFTLTLGGKVTLDFTTEVKAAIADLSMGTTLDVLLATNVNFGDGTSLLSGATASDYITLASDSGLALTDSSQLILNGNNLLLTGAVTVPEPATATLSLLALAALCARRRRKA